MMVHTPKHRGRALTKQCVPKEGIFAVALRHVRNHVVLGIEPIPRSLPQVEAAGGRGLRRVKQSFNGYNSAVQLRGYCSIELS